MNAQPGDPHAAFVVMNDPLEDKEKIQEYVKKGYLVRTRADAGTYEARMGDYTRFEAAKESGAQYISTDYYIPDPRFKVKYQISFEGQTYSKCNHLFPTVGCQSEALK